MHTAKAAFVRGVFQITLPKEYGSLTVALLLFFMATSLDFHCLSANQGVSPPFLVLSCLKWGRQWGREALQLKCLFLLWQINLELRVWTIILSYHMCKQHLFSAPFLWLHFFSRWNQAWDKSLQHFSHTPTHKSHFLPDLKCNSYRAVPIILVNTVPLPRSLVTIIYNLWIQPRNKAKKKMNVDWSVCGNETAFLYHVPASSGSFPFLDFFPNLLTQWLTRQLQFPPHARAHVVQ